MHSAFTTHTCLILYTDDPAADGDAKSGMRPKNLSGKLQVIIKGARDLEHAPIVTSGRSRSASKQVVDTYVSLKVEGTQRARTHPSRTDRWNEEFEITVDKANEVELAVYDKQASEPHPVPIALLWLKIQDLVDSLRRQRVNQETGQGGWVTAGDMNNIPGMPSPGHHPSSSGDYQPSFNAGGAMASGAFGGGYGGQPDGIEAWFALEPVGAIAMKLNFGMPFCPMLKPLIFLNPCSQGECAKAPSRCTWRPWPTRCRPQAQGRGSRDERTQICSKTILPTTSLRFL